MKIVAQRNLEEVRREAQAYLDSTDWMVTRMYETGKPIPENVKRSRAEARKTLSEYNTTGPRNPVWPTPPST